MRCAVFSVKPYDRQFLAKAAEGTDHELVFFEPRLTHETVRLAEGFEVICAFVNDNLDAAVLEQLSLGGTRGIALRCAGFNQVDLAAAEKLGIAVTRVPAYSPYAVAEHAVGLILALNRRLHRAYHRVRENNFSLDGLLGFDLHGRTVGVVGTGAIGRIFAKIVAGFGCNLLLCDKVPNADCDKLGKYVTLPQLLAGSDIISLHCPLLPATQHLINTDSLSTMRDNVMIINTSRGALIDTRAAIAGLKSGKIGYLGLDVYEEEGDLFFEDWSDQVVQDDVFARLLTFPNVFVTAHQAFFTVDALHEIARVTMLNLSEIETHGPLKNAVRKPN